MSDSLVENDITTLPCGCTTEIINGKSITVLCDQHEQEFQDMLIAPTYFKKTKMREAREI